MRRLPLIVLLLSSLLAASCQATADRPPTPEAQVEAGASPAVSVTGSTEYSVVEHFRIANHGPGSPSKHNLWAALIQDQPPYQQVLDMEISYENYRTFEDENGNLIAEFDLSGLPPGESLDLEIRYRLKVNQVAYDLSGCDGELSEFFTDPELYIESNNPQVRQLAAELAQETQNPCEQARLFYDYVAETLVYTFNGRDWGAQAALGEMGADCSEYASLTAALSRAAGIPARYLEGVLYLEGSTRDLARSEHAWLEVYLPGIGWAPLDPTLGRSLLLRDKYFAANVPDHIIVSRGRNPSPLRGASYYTHVYWPGPSAEIKIEDFGWSINPID